MRVVLADGTVQDVDHTSDLWWAMRGAGHNFGIVTSVTTKIYDVKHPSWAQKSFIFQRHQAGDVYSVLNDKVGKLPADVQIHSIVMYNPETSAVSCLYSSSVFNLAYFSTSRQSDILFRVGPNPCLGPARRRGKYRPNLLGSS